MCDEGKNKEEEEEKSKKVNNNEFSPSLHYLEIIESYKLLNDDSDFSSKIGLLKTLIECDTRRKKLDIELKKVSHDFVIKLFLSISIVVIILIPIVAKIIMRFFLFKF